MPTCRIHHVTVISQLPLNMAYRLGCRDSSSPSTCSTTSV